MTGVQTETGVLAGYERMLIDGELQFTGSGAKFDVVHPASEQVAGQATDGTVDDMARAVAAARRAFDAGEWSRDLEFRHHCLTQLHAALERNKGRVRRILITEVGCPITVTGSQIESPIDERHHQQQEPLRDHQPVRRYQAERPWLSQRRRRLQGVSGGQDNRPPRIIGTILTPKRTNGRKSARRSRHYVDLGASRVRTRE